ncbi:hypothetical protein ACFQMM_03620 [Saliphagus sp. GCM10025308]
MFTKLLKTLQTIIDALLTNSDDVDDRGVRGGRGDEPDPDPELVDEPELKPKPKPEIDEDDIFSLWVWK